MRLRVLKYHEPLRFPRGALVDGSYFLKKKARAIFFQGHSGGSQPRVFTEETVQKIKTLHLQGKSNQEICNSLDIKQNTFQKAISQNRLVLPALTFSSIDSDTKSERNIEDDNCRIGKSCCNETGRAMAACSGQPSIPSFGNHLDLSHGGILLTLPSLLATGLLNHIDRFFISGKYYTTEQIFISLAFLLLLRAKNLEQSRGLPCGELGRCMGLDRIPEVKTLRERIATFCGQADVDQWAAELSRDWLQGSEEVDGVLYIDGHVRLYYGHQVSMPKRFVSRMRLCLSGSTDYWINDRLGQPFFVVNHTLNEGMTKAIIQDVIPRLDRDIPNQPSVEALEENPLLHRYMLVFDRECYSIDFFKYLEENRIAFCTYRKNVKEDWGEQEFTDYEIMDEEGEKETIQLAERSTVLYGKKEKGVPQKSIIVREIRKRNASGHQTAIITTNYMLSLVQIAVLMFARWCQENYFKYMGESFGIDSITSYLKRILPDTSAIVNPEYKLLEKEQKKTSALLNKSKLSYANITLSDKELLPKEMEKYIKKKANLKQEIETLEEKRKLLIEKKKTIDKNVIFGEYYENQKLETSVNERKFFLDTIKIIAYRAETAMVAIIKKQMGSPDQARSLLRKLYSSDADIQTDHQNNILHVKIHRSNYKSDDKVLEFLCENLNETQTVFPGTNLTLVFSLVSL